MALGLGYTDIKITKTKYRVKYLGKDSTVVYKRFLKRSSEIAKREGYKYFTVSDLGSMSENISIGIGVGRSFSSVQNPQYEATITLSNSKKENSFSVKELIVE